MTMTYLSVCSGIEAASVAWQPLGWRPVGFAEIEAFPSAVLAHRHGSNMPGEPLSQNGVPNHGDFTTLIANPPARRLLVGGTPCQAFSIAGARRGLADARGNLTLAFVDLAHAIRSLEWVVWENVPGVLSMRDNAFGCLLGGLVGADDAIICPGGKWPRAGMAAGPLCRLAWRVLDAQHFGVPQRRARVFVVASFGGGDPAAVLFERKSGGGHPAPRRKAREIIASAAGPRAGGGGGLGADCAQDGGLITEAFGGGNTSGPVDVAATLTANGQRLDFEVETFIAHTLRAEGHDASEDGTGRGVPLVPVAYRVTGNDGAYETGGTTDALTTQTDPSSHLVAYAIQERAGADNVSAGPGGVGVRADVAYTLEARHHVQSVAFALRGREGGAQAEVSGDKVGALRAATGGSSRDYVATRWAVRRLTPRECERLQGFPDDYTQIPYRGRPAENCPDGPRYKALGNSMAVPVMRWIGERIAAQGAGRA